MMCENQTTLQGLMHHTLVVSETENLTQVDLTLLISRREKVPVRSEYTGQSGPE